uniref:Integrase core domain-containing protein n=1 Tax=Mycena chlorophos TaxID=658473 RepID=A0ABQ0M575_MYCCL|nr:predicted protein [Mycena chlorophos]
MAPRSNQFKLLPPIESVAPAIIKYWKMRKIDRDILDALKTHHIDLSQYGMGLTSFIKMREDMGLFRTRKQGHDVESIRPAMIRIRGIYPKAGRKEVSDILFHEENMSVPRSVIETYFGLYEPDLVLQRRANRLKRRRFWAAGVNDMWCVDQHDKWKPKFGLALHVGLDPFAGKLLWLNVWWTNSNPRLILKYYLDTVETLGYMPLITQSDPGVENFGMANAHTLLRQMHDPALVDTLQHRWMNEKKNVKPEIAWSQLRRRFTPGFEDILDEGVNNGWYDPKILIESLVFRFVFIPWLQGELTGFMERVNNTRKRADRNKILPHGVPNHIFETPEDYGALNFKVQVNPEHIVEVRNLYAPPAHNVFELVPPDFHALAMQFFTEIGDGNGNPTPPVARHNAWATYLEILGRFEHLDMMYRTPAELDAQWGYTLTMSRDDYRDDIELLPNYQNLPDAVQAGHEYLGGVNNGRGMDMSHAAELDAMMNRDLPLPHGSLDIVEVDAPVWFSDDEDSDRDAQEVAAELTTF